MGAGGACRRADPGGDSQCRRRHALRAEGCGSVNAAEQAALLAPTELFVEMRLAADDRTLEILERRRTATVHRRGWLVRRMLLGADVIGLLAAMLLAEWTLS